MLDVDGAILHGRTDAAGVLAVAISPAARRAKLTVGDGPPLEIFLGRVDPLTEMNRRDNACLRTKGLSARSTSAT